MSIKRRPLSKRQVRKVATIAKATVRKLSEWKVHDVAPASASIPLASLKHHLSAIAIGDTGLTRDGNVVHATSLTCRYTLEAQATDDLARVIVFQWNSDVEPDITDILDQPVGKEWLAPYQRKFGHQYKIMYDRTHQLSTLDSRKQVTVSMKLRVPRAKIVFNGAATTAEVGGLYMVAVSDDVAAGPVIAWVSRLNFRDG